MTREAKILTACAVAGMSTAWALPPAVGWVTWAEAVAVGVGIAWTAAWAAAATYAGWRAAVRGEAGRLDAALALQREALVREFDAQTWHEVAEVLDVVREDRP